MPLIRYCTEIEGEADLRAALANLPATAPVIVMVHGYKFSPHSQDFCPFTDILSLAPRNRARGLSWPRHLGVGRTPPEQEPLCIAFGWNSRGTIWRAWRAAHRAGRDLARLLALVAEVRGHGAQVIAHSLGALVTLSAIRRAPQGSVGRVVLLSGAAFRSNAACAMASPAGRDAEVLNVTSGENLMFDMLLEAGLGLGRRSIGRGFDGGANWVNLRIDDAGHAAALHGLGHRIARPSRRVCHWSGYLRPGVFGLYRRWFAAPETLPPAMLRAHLPAPRRARPAFLPQGLNLTGIAPRRPM